MEDTLVASLYDSAGQHRLNAPACRPMLVGAAGLHLIKPSTCLAQPHVILILHRINSNSLSGQRFIFLLFVLLSVAILAWGSPVAHPTRPITSDLGSLERQDLCGIWLAIVLRLCSRLSSESVLRRCPNPRVRSAIWRHVGEPA